MSKIIFKNLTIKLKGKILFNKLNFELNSGDKVMFLGKNGTGKSLLLELLTFGFNNDLASRYKGLEVEGEILDEDNNNLLKSDVKPGYMYISQNEEFYDNSTIYDEAKISCLGSKLELDEEFLDYLLTKFNLLDRKKKKIKNNVSFGEGKVIHIITKLLKFPNTKVIILDEPLNHLSFDNCKKFNDVMLELLAKYPDTIVIMISHCKAVSFPNKFMKYDYQKEEMYFKPYKCVKCFDDDEYERDCDLI